MPYISTDGSTSFDPGYVPKRPQDPATKAWVEQLAADLREPITIADAVLPTAYAGRSYSHTFTASGHGHRWSIVTDGIDGDAINEDTGAYTIPLGPAPGTYSVQVNVTNGFLADSKTLPLTVATSIDPIYLLSDGSVPIVDTYVPTQPRSIMTAHDIIALATP